MVDSKNWLASFVLTVLLLLPGLTPVSKAADSESGWTTLSSFKFVRQSRLINDTLYLATSGGILTLTGSDQPSKQYVNLDGLGTVDITDIIVDADGQKWVSGFGRLIKFNGTNSQQYLFFDNDGELFRLTCLADDGDQLWVGTEIGLVLFSKTNDGGQIEDSYSLYGNLNASPEINQIMLSGDSIWLCTSAGLAMADRRNPNLLKSPSNWRVIGPDKYPQLGVGLVQRVVPFESDIYLATGRGLYRLEMTPTDTTLVQMPVGINTPYMDLQVQNDSLFLFYSWAAAVIKEGKISGLPITGLPSVANTGFVLDGVRWLAAKAGGLFYLSGDSYVEYPYTGAPGNNVSDITVNRDGVITAGFSGDGVGHYLDGVWYEQPVFVGNRSTYVISDPSGSAWVGTFGQGLWQITDSGVVRYDETNSTLIGNSSNDAYVVIYGLATDGQYIYAACYRAVNDLPLAFGNLSQLDNPDEWGALGGEEGITTAFVLSLDYANGYIAMGTESNGVFKCRVGSDPFNCPDSCCVHYTEADWNLISDGIRVVKFDPEGQLWAATNFGLSFFDPLAAKDGKFVDVVLPAGFGPDVRALEFDRRGSVWLGSGNGLAYLNAATGEKILYTSVNSGLVSDEVQNLHYDVYTGDLYVATTAGISVFKSTTGPPTEALDSVYAFPNPYVVTSSDDLLSFNYALPGTVSIFTIDGVLVYEMPAGDTWNGNNLAGKPVASGVYLFVITDADGNVARDKFLLVRGR